jgi:hypothetical protein
MTENFFRISCNDLNSSSLIFAGFAFSSTLADVLAPGMGIIVGMPGFSLWYSTQPSAIWAGVTPFCFARSATASASLTFSSKTSGWKRGK